MCITRILRAVVLVLALAVVAPVAAFPMGMGGAPAPGVGVGLSMSNPAMIVNGGNASFAHGSPAGVSNPAVGMMEARQRQAQVSAELDQARKAGKDIHAADARRQQGEKALASEHPGEAMSRFDDAERAVGIHASGTVMGAYSKSGLGSANAGGTELSGAIVH